MESHFGAGAPPILVYFSGDWDVYWGYDLDFDPWSFGSLQRLCHRYHWFLQSWSSRGSMHLFHHTSSLTDGCKWQPDTGSGTGATAGPYVVRRKLPQGTLKQLQLAGQSGMRK